MRVTKRRAQTQPRTFSGALLMQARIEAGLRREELAVNAGISHGAVVSYEARGTVPTANILARLAAALRMPIDDLFT
jgi:transcriptional regulator with XRE-family HTH domain